jgi:hypothetical protein
MTSEYKVHFLSPAGVLRAVVTDFTSLHLLREVNGIGDLAITLRGDHPALASLEYKSILEVWRRDRTHRLDWYCEARYIYLYYSHSTKEIGRVVIKAVDPLWFLSTRIIAWEEETTDRTLFYHSPGNIIKLLVKYNATAAATVAAGRFREGNIPQVTIESTITADTAITLECAYRNLLTVCQAIAPLSSSGDFTMHYLTAGVWEFRWRPVCLGVDRSTSLTFSLELGNMAEPVYIDDRRQEKTVAIIGGHIWHPNLTSRVRLSPDYAADNDEEMWLPLPGIIHEDAMDNAADAAFKKLKKFNSLTFKFLQTPTAFYGVDYFLGDLVTTLYEGISRVQQIRSVSIDAAPTGETSLVVSCI